MYHCMDMKLNSKLLAVGVHLKLVGERELYLSGNEQRISVSLLISISANQLCSLTLRNFNMTVVILEVNSSQSLLGQRLRSLRVSYIQNSER